jgi:RNA polymerase sigma factor (sigma-70 family)
MVEQPLIASQPTDRDLLRRYATDGPDAQPAFAQLVARHLALVYSAARRQLRDAAAADDVTQAVFWVLARKARALAADPRLVLPAWLWSTTRLAALAALRREHRLKRRERTAAQMRQERTDDAGIDSAWDDLSPHLDAALATLRESDRRAVILRYFEGRALREVGASLGVSEDAAKQRVSRAIAKVRTILTRRGIGGASAASLAVLVAAHATDAAPPSLADRIASAALSDASPALARATLRAMILANVTPVIVATALAPLCIIAIILTVQAVTGRNPTPTPSAMRPPATAPATQPQIRQPTFEDAYALAPGEILKRVPPPPIAARQRLFDQLDPQRRSFDPRAAYMLISTDKGVQNIRGPLGPHTLHLLLSYGLDIPAYSIDLPDTLRTMRLSGDWVVRQGSTDADKLPALARILERDWNLKITFTRQTIEREVLVAKGQFKPADAKLTPMIDLCTTQRPTGKDHAEGDLPALLRTAGELAGVMILDESASPKNVKLHWRFGKGVLPNTPLDDENATLLLDHLADQTGLEFKREIRPVELWLGRETR